MTNSNPFENKDPDATDRTLIRRFRAGEQDAASELYLRYAKRLRTMATRQTSSQLAVRSGSEDIVQSVFRTFFRRVSNGQYDVVDGEDLWRLFLVIALNKIRTAAEFNYAQKRDVRRTKSVEPDYGAHLSGNDEGEHVAYMILKMTMDDLFADLPAKSGEIVRLRVEGFAIDEISEKSGSSKRTIERVLQQFRKLLLKEVEE